jgi:hypothetical protein
MSSLVIALRKPLHKGDFLFKNVNLATLEYSVLNFDFSVPKPQSMAIHFILTS